MRKFRYKGTYHSTPINLDALWLNTRLYSTLNRVGLFSPPHHETFICVCLWTDPSKTRFMSWGLNHLLNQPQFIYWRRKTQENLKFQLDFCLARGKPKAICNTWFSALIYNTKLLLSVSPLHKELTSKIVLFNFLLSLD